MGVEYQGQSAVPEQTSEEGRPRPRPMPRPRVCMPEYPTKTISQVLIKEVVKNDKSLENVIKYIQQENPTVMDVTSTTV